MFRKNYQGGAVVEVFSGQGKDPAANWRLCGGASAVHKEYDKELKGFVFSLEGSSQTVKMQMPENGRMSLGLLQRFLVLQVNVHQSRDFSVELVITDVGHLKRRLCFSTVHRELSVTLWHAKIPFAGLKRNTWTTVCIDLVSFGQLFKDTAFLSLDGITLFASCKVRRIFTMKTEPRGPSGDDGWPGGTALPDLIPLNCRLPPDLHHRSQLLNVESVRSAGGAPDRPVGSSCRPKPRPRTGPPSAAGPKPGAPPPPNGRRSKGSEGDAASVRNPVHLTCRTLQKEENPTGTTKEPPGPAASPGEPPASGRPRQRKTTREPDASSPRRPTSTTPTQSPQPACEENQEGLSSPDRAEDTRIQGCTVKDLRPGSSTRLRLWSSSGSEEEPGSRTPPGQGVFRFSSQPHSPRRGDGVREEKGEAEAEVAAGGGGRRRPGPPPEEDFFGSESEEEDESFASHLHPPARSLNPDPAPPLWRPDQTPNPDPSGSPETPRPASTAPQVLFGSRAPGFLPIRCLSPCGGGPDQAWGWNPGPNGHSGVSLSRRLLQEVHMDGSRKQEKGKEMPEIPTRGLPGSESQLVEGDEEEEDEELQMLESLKRQQQQEDDDEAAGLSASQIQRCNISVSMSCEDPSTWTHISTPADQGLHYQKEMDPLLSSNPREWMDVLSPPLVSPSQWRRSDHDEDPIAGGTVVPEEEEGEEEFLNLLYDPCLRCYFDPRTGKYYELA